MKKQKLTTLAQAKNKYIGKKGTPKRDVYEKKLKAESYKEKNMTPSQKSILKVILKSQLEVKKAVINSLLERQKSGFTDTGEFHVVYLITQFEQVEIERQLKMLSKPVKRQTYQQKLKRISARNRRVSNKQTL